MSFKNIEPKIKSQLSLHLEKITESPSHTNESKSPQTAKNIHTLIEIMQE